MTRSAQSASNVPATQMEESNRLREIFGTPLTRLARGRIGTLRTELARTTHDLPPDLRALVLVTTQRSRLWFSEQLEVARELTSHFLDGIETGAVPADLASAFGDPALAAKMIRRGKRRNRPLFLKLLLGLLNTVNLILILCLVLYAVQAVRVFTSSPNVSRNYLAELNAPARAVPEQERAWPLYREAMARLTQPMPRYDEIDLTPNGLRWETMRRYVRENAATLDLCRRAAEKPHLGHELSTALQGEMQAPQSSGSTSQSAGSRPADSNPMLLEVLLPAVSELNAMARLFAVDAHDAALANDGERAANDVEAILRFAEHCREMPALIADIVAQSLATRACGVVATILRDRPAVLSDAHLRRLAHRLDGAAKSGVYEIRVDIERTFFEDIIQRTYTDDGRGGGIPSRQFYSIMESISLDNQPRSGGGRWVLAPLAALVVADRGEQMRKYNEILNLVQEEARTPLWLRGPSPADQELDRISSSTWLRVRYSPLAILMPSLTRALRNSELARQRHDGTLVAIALEAYRRDHGAWPASLAEITPDFLPSIPVDRMNGARLRYQLVDGAPRVYSVGPDRIDQSGQPPAEDARANYLSQWTPGAPDALAPPGDWILWPPIDSKQPPVDDSEE